ncbi:MAG: HAD family hydrolase [Elainella sp. Prado103]|jgi:HAD superfamily hydrolase (TIGR01509 family)|nr:HAD family hydrolase [Elainella sp. Prado103]
MLQLQALIFDVDGTLAETERDGHRVAFNQAFAAAGLDWHWSIETYRELLEIGGGKERIRWFWQQYRPDFLPALPPGLSPADWIASLHRQKTYCYSQLLQAGKIALRPGVKRLLTEAHATGIRLAIATTSSPENVTTLLETTFPESLDWFEVIAAGDVVPAKKPAPDIYQYVLAQMRLAPEHCLVIEDSPIGLQAARKAGLATVITVNNYTQQDCFADATLVLDSLGEPRAPGRVLQSDPSLIRPNAKACFDLALSESLLRHQLQPQLV